MTQYHIAPHKPTIVRIGDGTPPAYAALGGDTPENLRDHAEFIVKACNSHAKLVEALAMCVDNMEHRRESERHLCIDSGNHVLKEND